MLNLKTLADELKKKLQQGASNVGNFAKQSAQILPPVQAYNAVRNSPIAQRGVNYFNNNGGFRGAVQRIKPRELFMPTSIQGRQTMQNIADFGSNHSQKGANFGQQIGQRIQNTPQLSMGPILDFKMNLIKKVAPTALGMVGSVPGEVVRGIAQTGREVSEPSRFAKAPLYIKGNILGTPEKPTKAGIAFDALTSAPDVTDIAKYAALGGLGAGIIKSSVDAKALKPLLPEIRSIINMVGEKGRIANISIPQLTAMENAVAKIRGSNSIKEMRRLAENTDSYLEGLRAVLLGAREQILNPTVNIGFTTKSIRGQATDPLIQEARKYKSAEEYIKAQGDRIYKGKNFERAKYFDTPKIKSQLTDIYNQSTKGVESMPVVGKERGFTTSVQEAPNVIDPVKAKVNSMYNPKANTTLMGEAQALLQDGATIDFKNVEGVDKKVAATIQEALNAQKSGNHQLAANLFNNLSEQGTELGRGVQAFSLLPKMSPEAVSLSVAGKIKKYNSTAMRKIPELTGEQQKVIADQITALDLLKGREKNIALSELQNTINSFIPSSVADKVLAVWKAGLLTSLRTHERNFLGNLIHGGLEVAKDIPASIADIGLSKVTGQRTKAFTTKGIREFATKDTGQQMKDIISRGYDPSETINKFDYKTITWGNNPVEQALKKYTDVVFRTLGASDKPFYNAALSRSLYDQATTAAINAGKQGDKAFIENLVKNPTEDILKIAIGDANVATFKNKNAATAISSAIKNAMSSEKFGPIGSEIGKVVGEITMPFTGVPSSILGQIINYSPAGLLKGIVNVGRVALTDVPNLQRRAVEELGRGVIGTGIFGLGAYLASKGLITGQPKDATEQRLWDTQNKPRNSIMIGGKWRSLNSIGPEAVVFLAGAKLNEERNNPEGSAANYAMSLGKDYLDQSFVQGIKAPINALTDPSRYAKSYAGQTISSVIPNIVKDTGKAFDPYMREANSVMDYAKSSTPILRNTMLPSRDVLGRIRKQEPSGIGAFIDLFNSKTPVTNQVVDELERLYQTGNNATPGKIGKSQTIGGVKMDLTPDELDQLEATVGAEGQSQLKSLMNNSGYQTLSDEDKANAIGSLLTSIRKRVRGTIKLSPKAGDSSVPAATASEGLGQIYTLINQETGTVKQVDLYSPIEYPELTGISNVDKKLISGYKSDVNARLSDAIKLYQSDQITLEELKKISGEVESQLAKSKKAKKPKKITIKYSNYKPQKITIKRSKKRVSPTIKKPKRLKSNRRYTIKLK